MIIDSHVHYAHARYNTEFPYLDSSDGVYSICRADRDRMIANMKQKGIGGFIEASIHFDDIDKQLAVVSKHSDYMWCSIGIHPAGCYRTSFAKRAALADYAERNHPVAIGETGLDYHYPRMRQHRLKQMRWFVYQIKLADKLNLPLVLHIREAHKDALRILKKYRRILHGGVVHCFRGDEKLAQEYISLGFVIGIGGKLLGGGEEAQTIGEAVKQIPLSAIVVETDAPYVLPELPDLACSNKQRHKLCNSSLILPVVIRTIAELRGEDAQHVEDVIFENTVRVFRLPANGGDVHE